MREAGKKREEEANKNMVIWPQVKPTLGLIHWVSVVSLGNGVLQWEKRVWVGTSVDYHTGKTQDSVFNGTHNCQK